MSCCLFVAMVTMKWQIAFEERCTEACNSFRFHVERVSFITGGKN